MDLIKELHKQADIIRNKSAYYGEIEIKPLTVSQYFGILPIINSIQIDGDVTKENVHELVPPQIAKYKDEITEIFKIALDIEIGDLLPVDLYHLIGIINMQMDHGNFSQAITSISALSKTSKVDLIANQQRMTKNQQRLNEQNCSTQ